MAQNNNKTVSASATSAVTVEIKNNGLGRFAAIYKEQHTNADALTESTDENAGFNPAKYKVDNSYFDGVVKYLTEMDSEEFIALIYWAKTHGNKFPKCVDEIAEVKNANDFYCAVLINLSRYLGEDVETKTFDVIQSEVKTMSEKAEFLNQLKNIYALEMPDDVKAEIAKAIVKMLSF